MACIYAPETTCFSMNGDFTIDDHKFKHSNAQHVALQLAFQSFRLVLPPSLFGHSVPPIETQYSSLKLVCQFFLNCDAI